MRIYRNNTHETKRQRLATKNQEVPTPVTLTTLLQCFDFSWLTAIGCFSAFIRIASLQSFNLTSPSHISRTLQKKTNLLRVFLTLRESVNWIHWVFGSEDPNTQDGSSDSLEGGRMNPEIASFDYWFNWRVLLCAVWVLTPMFVSLFVIWKYEDSSVETRQLNSDDNGGSDHTVLCVDDAWRPCFERIHPGWLLGFRVLALCFLLATNIARLAFRGWRIYYYYTQWTYTLIAIYFGMGSLLSVYGCVQHKKQLKTRLTADAEDGLRSPLNGEKMVLLDKSKASDSKALRSSVHLFQIIFQMSAGAAVLTDSIYWTVIFPFLSLQDYEMGFMTVNLHTSNLFLLLCDTTLNRLRFPLFRFSYFILWTGSFVIFQWIVHLFVSVGWPYPFLDLSLSMAPVWYLLVALLHLPSYGLYALLVRIKYKLKSFAS